MEDYFLALQSLEDVETGKSKIWSHEDIEKGRDLEG
jgi:predicted DNA-binding protein